MYDKPSLCAKCGGKCCRAMPGACHPREFGEPFDIRRLRTALVGGRYTLDWWEGDVRGLSWDDPNVLDRCWYARPAFRGREHQFTDSTWTGHCTFYQLNTGCMLESNKRPYECQMLEPGDADAGELCDKHGVGKKEMVIAWLDYHTQINLLVEELNKCKQY